MSRVKATFSPKLTIRENAERAGVSETTVRQYMRYTGISAAQNNYEHRLQCVCKALEELQRKEIDATLKALCEQTGFAKKTVQKYLSIIKNNGIKSDMKFISYFIPNSKTIIKSVSENQVEILGNIMRLYCPEGFDCDLTYSEGKFYKKIIPAPPHKYDIFPQAEGVKPLSAAQALPDEVFSSIVIDLPFIIRKSATKNSMIENRFAAFETKAEMFQVHTDMLSLAFRLLKNEGILVLKTQDINFAGQQIFTHQFVMNEAVRIGYVIEDLFILTATRFLQQQAAVDQRHARKVHSYFLVLRKS